MGYVLGPIPAGWQRNGKIEFENVSIQHEPGTTPILKNINLTISPGERVNISFQNSFF